MIVDQRARIFTLELQVDQLREALMTLLYFVGKGGTDLDFGGRSHPMLELVSVLEQMSDLVVDVKDQVS